MKKPTFLIDTREQTPLVFSDAIETRRVCLDVGDYAILGLQRRIIAERKSFSDFLGSIGTGRVREDWKNARMMGYPRRLYLIETTWGHILSERWLVDSRADGFPSTRTMNHVIGRLNQLLDDGFLVMLVENHRTAGIILERYFLHAIEIVKEEHRIIKDLAATPAEEYLTIAQEPVQRDQKGEAFSQALTDFGFQVIDSPAPPLKIVNPLDDGGKRIATRHLNFARGPHGKS